MMERGQQVKSDTNKQGWEQAEFPIVCETCLGDNPFVKMMSERFGAECKICNRPYTVFRWKAGTQGRFKRTVICQTCAKTKNACQTCILDLQYGLPIQVRDNYLANKIDMPNEIANREFFIHQNNKNIENMVLPYDDPQILKIPEEAKSVLKQHQSSEVPKRNMPKVCSFWEKGNCARGAECPYTHAKIHEKGGNMSKQSYKSRYHGLNDPVALKLLEKIKTAEQEKKKLEQEKIQAEEKSKQKPNSRPLNEYEKEQYIEYFVSKPAPPTKKPQENQQSESSQNLNKIEKITEF